MPLLGEDGAHKRPIEDPDMTVDSESERLKMLEILPMLQEEEDRRARVKEDIFNLRLDRMKELSRKMKDAKEPPPKDGDMPSEPAVAEDGGKTSFEMTLKRAERDRRSVVIAASGTHSNQGGHAIKAMTIASGHEFTTEQDHADVLVTCDGKISPTRKDLKDFKGLVVGFEEFKTTLVDKASKPPASTNQCASADSGTSPANKPHICDPEPPQKKHRGDEPGPPPPPSAPPPPPPPPPPKDAFKVVAVKQAVDRKQNPRWRRDGTFAIMKTAGAHPSDKDQVNFVDFIRQKGEVFKGTPTVEAVGLKVDAAAIKPFKPHIDFVASKLGGNAVQHVQGRMSPADRRPTDSKSVSTWHYDGTPVYKMIDGKRHVLVGRQLTCVYGTMSIRTEGEFDEVVIEAGESHTFVGDCGLEVKHVAEADGSRAMLKVDHYALCDDAVLPNSQAESDFATDHFTALSTKVCKLVTEEHCSSGAAPVAVEEIEVLIDRGFKECPPNKRKAFAGSAGGQGKGVARLRDLIRRLYGHKRTQEREIAQLEDLLAAAEVAKELGEELEEGLEEELKEDLEEGRARLQAITAELEDAEGGRLPVLRRNKSEASRKSGLGKGVHETLEELRTLRAEGDALALESGDLVTQIEEIEATFQKPSSMMELLEQQRRTAPLHERLEILDDEMRANEKKEMEAQEKLLELRRNKSEASRKGGRKGALDKEGLVAEVEVKTNENGATTTSGMYNYYFVTGRSKPVAHDMGRVTVKLDGKLITVCIVVPPLDGKWHEYTKGGLFTGAGRPYTGQCGGLFVKTKRLGAAQSESGLVEEVKNLGAAGAGLVGVDGAGAPPPSKKRKV